MYTAYLHQLTRDCLHVVDTDGNSVTIPKKCILDYTITFDGESRVKERISIFWKNPVRKEAPCWTQIEIESRSTRILIATWLER